MSAKKAKWLLEKAFEKFNENDLEYDLVKKKENYSKPFNSSSNIKYSKITKKIFDEVTTEVRSLLGIPLTLKNIIEKPKNFSISEDDFKNSFFYVVYHALSGKFIYESFKKRIGMNFYKYAYFNYKGNVFKIEYTYGKETNSCSITFMPLDDWIKIPDDLNIHTLDKINEDIEFFIPSTKLSEIVA